MDLKIKVYGIDGDDAAELEELLWSVPELSDLQTSLRNRDSVPLGTIYASATMTVMICVFKFVALGVAGEVTKDAYKAARRGLSKKLRLWQDKKNATLDPRHRIHLTLSDDGEYVIE